MGRCERSHPISRLVGSANWFYEHTSLCLAGTSLRNKVYTLIPTRNYVRKFKVNRFFDFFTPGRGVEKKTQAAVSIYTVDLAGCRWLKNHLFSAFVPLQLYLDTESYVYNRQPQKFGEQKVWVEGSAQKFFSITFQIKINWGKWFCRTQTTTL